MNTTPRITLIEGDVREPAVMDAIPNFHFDAIITAPTQWWPGPIEIQKTHNLRDKTPWAAIPGDYLDALVGIFLKLNRKLKDDGYLAIVFGDSPYLSPRGLPFELVRKLHDTTPYCFLREFVIGHDYGATHAIQHEYALVFNLQGRAGLHIGRMESRVMQAESYWPAKALIHPKGVPFAITAADVASPLIAMLTEPGGNILDPFAGVGTIGHVAKLEGRNATCIEIEPESVATARKIALGEPIPWLMK